MLLPISTLLAAWALWLRIDQYGLTPDRLWAGVILLFTAGYTFSYAALMLWKWTDSIWHIQAANKWLALLIAVVLILVNTPLADLRDWSAQSQASRLLNEEVEVAKFDYTYMRFSLGAYGVRALNEIENSEFAQDKPEIAKRIAAAKKQKNRWEKEPIVDTDNLAAVAELFEVIPENAAMPDGLLKKIIDEQARCLNTTTQCKAFEVPTSDQGADWLVTQGHSNCPYGTAYVQHEEEWFKMGGVSTSGCCKYAEDNLDNRELNFTRLQGPFLAYSRGRCIYAISADKDYLLRFVPDEMDEVEPHTEE